MSFLDKWADWLPALLSGLQVSCSVTLTALAVGMPLGLVLALMRMSKPRLIRGIAWIVVEVGRGGPAIVVLYLVYFGLPGAGIVFSARLSAALALGYVAGAYFSELFRGAIEAVPRAQWAAADAVGLTYMQRLRYVILPQAIRIGLPPVVGLTILIFQATALVYTISLRDLLARGYDIGSVSYDYLSPLLFVGVVYCTVTMIGLGFSGLLERRLGRHLD